MKKAITGFIAASAIAIVFMSGTASGSIHSYDYISEQCAPVWPPAGIIELKEIGRPQGPSIIWAWVPYAADTAVTGYVRYGGAAQMKKPEVRGIMIAAAREEQRALR